MDTKYYCSGTFHDRVASPLCGVKGCTAAPEACDVYWRNVSHYACDKCCNDVQRWNGENYSIVIRRSSTCYNLASEYSRKCTGAGGDRETQAQSTFKRIQVRAACLPPLLVETEAALRRVHAEEQARLSWRMRSFS